MPRPKKIKLPKVEDLVKYSDDEVLPPTPPPSGSIAPKKFEYKRISATMLKTWNKCKRQFHKQYVEGIKSSANTSFTLGTAVHFALEQANLSLQGKPRQFNPFEIEDYVKTFVDMAASLHVMELGLFEVGQRILRDELENCNKTEKILGVEQEFNILTPEGVRIYGFMDLITEVDSTTIRVVDYKTSNMPLTYEDARIDEQLSMYDLAVRLMYPQYEKRILELRYLKSGEPVRSYRSDIESSNFRKVLLGVHEGIIKYLAELKDDSPLPNGDLNSFCNWCSYKQSCPQYVEAVNTQLPDAPSTLELTDENFIETYERVSLILKSAEMWKDSLKIFAIARLEADPETPISSGKREVSMSSGSRRDYDLDKFLKLGLSNDVLMGKITGKPLVKPVGTAIEEYAKSVGDPKLSKKVDELISIKYNSPTLRVRNTK